MKTIPLYILSFLVFSESQRVVYGSRTTFQSSFPSEPANLQIAGIDVESFGNTAQLPAHDAYPYSPGVEKFLPLDQYTHPEISFEAEIQTSNTPLNHRQLHQIPPVQSVSSNAIDKPVQESQEYVPPQSVGTAIIPMLPPPATPVNAAAANVPSNGGAVFLGSGSLGVIDLGGGAYALGSGGLGYSDRRQNPRSSIKSPVLPPIGADPSLVPAAVSTPQQETPFVYRNYQSPVQPTPSDQNGYEFLRPDRVGFGDPLPIRPLKTTNTYATPTNLLVRPQGLQQPVYQQFYQNVPIPYSSSYLK